MPWRIYLIIMAVGLSCLGSIAMAAKTAEISDNLPPQWQNILNPFTTDGCSRYPDGKILNCCKRHDLAYWQGGTSSQRLDADNQLRACILRKTGSAFKAWYVWKAVRDMGGPLRKTTYRWGYGWKFMRPYGPLTPDELQQVHALMPVDATTVAETKATSWPLPLPPLHQNHCVDAVYDYLNEHHVDLRIFDLTSWQVNLGSDDDNEGIGVSDGSGIDMVSLKTLDHNTQYEFEFSRNRWHCEDDIYLPEDMQKIRIVRVNIEN